jgi:shikimate dehydrogenase
MGANVITISRSGENHYGNLHLHSDAAIIVNTTPVGMYPNVGVSPLDIRLFPRLEGVLDAIYNPSRPQLLMDAEQRGIVAMNGLLMLVAQAKEGAEWFTGQKISDEVIDKIHRELRNEMENIILVGMPGSGKSTVGTILAQKTGKKLVDSDAYLVEKAGRPIPEIFATEGEATFRAMEAEVLAELGKQSGMIIATGGGCVTQERNYPSLHQNGTIFCLNRALEKLPMNGRPLSQSNKLEDMYRTRKPMYDHFADFHIDNNGEPEAAADAILKILEGNL